MVVGAKDKNQSRKGWELCGLEGYQLRNGMSKESLTDKVTPKYRCVGSEGLNHVDRGSSTCRGPVVEASLMWLRNTKKFTVAGSQWKEEVWWEIGSERWVVGKELTSGHRMYYP